MEGQRLSHYDILERLGGGGMGVVYKALDTKLQRHVALKVLPHNLTRDEAARVRFVQEAQAASALDHPNICTIHEVDATDDGQLFIVMGYYDGETLKKLVGRGRVPVEQAVDIAGQMANGLAKAHAAGIVHRDVKPANVMVTGDGLVKILDFGIAKLLGVTGPTIEGSTLGTVSYMSPEQVAGQDATPRSDLWSLGVVLYEMLTGEVPFPGQSPWAVMNSIANVDAPDPVELSPDVPPEVTAIVTRLLHKDPEHRFDSAEATLEALRHVGEPASGRSVGPSGRSRAAAAAAAAIVLVALGGVWMASNRRAEERRAREETLPQALALLEQDDYEAAFSLAGALESVIPDDPILDEVWGRAAVTGSISSEPAGAEIFVRPYGADDGAWRSLGVTPVSDVRLVRNQPIQLRLEREGSETLALASGVPGFYFGRGENTATARLHPRGSLPEEMVYVPGGDFPVRITGFNSAARISVPAFLIDRYEVTNAEYLEFVEAGGYEDRQYWAGLDFVRDGERLSWEEAMAAFVDATDRPGPAGWEFGRYPEGRDAYPVAGVSWYEAAAYLAFRNKSLPTIFHWARAALEPHSNAQPLARSLIPAANFGGEGPRPVGASGAMTSHGAFDMAGNVREWTWNESGAHRWILGGAWDDDPRMYSVRFTSPPFDRSSRHGFRGVRYPDGPPQADLMAPVDLSPRDYRGAVAVSDDLYEAYRRLLAYVPSPFEATVEEVDETAADHIWEYVSIDRSGSDEPFGLVVVRPKGAPGPHPAIVYFTGIGPFQTRQAAPLREATRGPLPGSFDYLVRSGRAVVIPLWAGSFERWDEFLSMSGDQYLRAMGSRVGDWASDLGVTLDYLETRDDIRGEQVGYLGISFGASTSLALLALEPRLEAALLLLPGFTYRDLPPEADAVNHVPRVRMPVLMIGGRYDYVFPVQTAQQPLYDQLGTPEEDKTFLLYEMGHGPFPRGQLIRDVLPFMDRHLPLGN